MKMRSLFFFISTAAMLLSSFLFGNAAHAQNSDQIVQLDSLTFERFLADSVRMDSARKTQMQRQEHLRRELDSLSRSDLGTSVLEWNHVMDIEVERAGSSMIQRFWFDPKLQEGPFIWHGDTLRNNEWLWFDPNQRRMATLFLNSNQGNYVSKRLAEMSGMMGNGTEIAKKKSSNWQKESDGETLRFTLQTAAGKYTLTLGPKNPVQAAAAVNWLKMQPIEGVLLPSAVKKSPIASLQLQDADERIVYSARVIAARYLDPAFSFDLSEIKINDPERNLNVIAKEWVEKNKKKEAEE